MTYRLLIPLLVAFSLLLPGAASAQEEDDSTRARPADSAEETKEIVAPKRERRGIVKVIQKKYFLKYRRLEVTPQLGYVGNDHFIQRLSVGASIGYHINDLLNVEFVFNYLPDLEETDYKSLTKRFRSVQEVVPDISRITFLGVVNLSLSPIYGKIELGANRIINYDIYLGAGFGVAMSKDDTAIIQSPCDQWETASQRKEHPEDGCEFVDQAHFVTNAGGGLRVVFNEWIGIRLDARQFTHIEQVYRDGDIGLEMKQNFMISVGASFFLPPKARAL